MQIPAGPLRKDPNKQWLTGNRNRKESHDEACDCVCVCVVNCESEREKVKNKEKGPARLRLQCMMGVGEGEESSRRNACCRAQAQGGDADGCVVAFASHAAGPATTWRQRGWGSKTLHSDGPPREQNVLHSTPTPLPHPHTSVPRKKNAVQTYLLLPAKCYAYSRGGGRSVCCAAWHPIRRCAMSARRGASKLREQIRLIVGRDKDPAATGPTAPPFYISVAMTSRSPLNHVLIHVINK
jgi:hypothetical protein